MFSLDFVRQDAGNSAVGTLMRDGFSQQKISFAELASKFCCR